MRFKFPTAALAVVEFDVDAWPDARTGVLRAFVRPADVTA
jgi:hypothetical protein